MSKMIGLESLLRPDTQPSYIALTFSGKDVEGSGSPVEINYRINHVDSKIHASTHRYLEKLGVSGNTNELVQRLASDFNLESVPHGENYVLWTKSESKEPVLVLTRNVSFINDHFSKRYQPNSNTVTFEQRVDSLYQNLPEVLEFPVHLTGKRRKRHSVAPRYGITTRKLDGQGRIALKECQVHKGQSGEIVLKLVDDYETPLGEKMVLEVFLASNAPVPSVKIKPAKRILEVGKFYSTTIDTAGRISIPKPVRRKLGWQEDQRYEVRRNIDRIVILAKTA